VAVGEREYVRARNLYGRNVALSRVSAPLRYRAAWWIPGAHLRTLWGKMIRLRQHVDTRRERWETPDGDFLNIDRLDAPTGQPRLVILHGLEGSSNSHYARGLLAAARSRGWAADVPLFRSCGGEPNRLLRSYHSGETGDLDFVLRELIAAQPDQPIVLTGVSLGGNVLLKWLGEQSECTPPQIAGAVAVSVPFDLARGSMHLQRGFSRLYQSYFLKSLRKKALGKAARFPGRLDPVAVARSSTLWDFDDAVTAPIHGFRDARDYYEQSSSIRWLDHIRVPTLLLNAVDDPFLPPSVLDEARTIARTNSALQIEFVDKGGHVGFISGVAPWRPVYYAEARAMEFLDAAVHGPAARP